MLSETVILAINKKIHELVITLSENSCCEKYHNSSVFSDCVGGKTGICTPADGEASQVRNVAVQTRYLQVGSAIGGWVTQCLTHRGHRSLVVRLPQHLKRLTCVLRSEGMFN